MSQCIKPVHARELVSNVHTRLLDKGFELKDIGNQVPGSEGSIFMSVRKEPLELVQELFSKQTTLALKPVRVYDEHGQRVYNEMWTAEKWEEDQVRHVA